MFPTEGMRHEMAQASSYTLGVGQHEFPFAFKVLYLAPMFYEAGP